jgi:hypothetical protein
MAEDSFEKARKAFFGIATTTPNRKRGESQTSLARSDAQESAVLEKLPFRNSVLEPDRDKLQAYTTSKEDAINGHTPSVIGQNLPE